MYIYIYIYIYVYIYTYICIYVYMIYMHIKFIKCIYKNLQVNAIVRLPHPWSGDSQGSNHHPSLSTLRSKVLSRS